MDVYHKPEIFVRRMLYKPNWWKDYFNPEQVHWQTSLLPARDSTLFWDIPSKKINEESENDRNLRNITSNKRFETETDPKEVVKVKMLEIDIPKKQKSEIIYIKNKNHSNCTFVENRIYNMPSKQKSEIVEIKSKNNRCQSNCIFEENRSRPLSPILPMTENPKMRRKTIVRKQTTSLPPTSDYCAWRKIFESENVPFTSAEGKIIKDLVLERFYANKLGDGHNTSTRDRSSSGSYKLAQSRKLQDIIKRFSHDNSTNVVLSRKSSFQGNGDRNCEKLKNTNVNENSVPIKTFENLSIKTQLYPKLSPLKSHNHFDIVVLEREPTINSKLSASKPSVATNFSTGSSFQNSFDADKFLDEALGDEFYSSVSTTGNAIQTSRTPTKSHNNIEHHGSVSCNEITSVCTAEASDLLSHRDLPSNMKYSIKTNTSEHSHGSTGASNSLGSGSGSGSSNGSNGRLTNNDKKIMYLMQQAAEQHYHMQQASKALSVCRITKEFTFSEERLEAERLLLLAVLKNRAILEEINRMDHDGCYNENYQQGKLTISNVRVPITKSDRDSIHRKFQTFTQWYLCIGIYGSQVHCSTTKTPNADQELHFDEPMIFSNLPPDFVLDLFVYFMEQPRNIPNFSHTSKYHLDTEYKCPTPKKFFKKHIYKNASTISRTSLNDYIRTPSFKLAGHIKIDLNNLNVNFPRELKSVHRYLHGTIHMDITTNLQIFVKCSGFLTFGSEAGGYPIWNRYWCLLDGHCLKFWNYPADADVKDPIRMINLKKCITPRIEIASEQVCSRPRTLLIETVRPKGPEDKNSLIMECIDDQTIIRYLLCCDAEKDLKKWSKQINMVVTFLKLWNLLDHN